MKSLRLILAVGIALALLIALDVVLVGQHGLADAPVLSPKSPAQTVTIAGCNSSGQYQPVLDEFTSNTGITTVYEVNCDQNQYRSCSANQDCPDAAIVPWPSLLSELGGAGTLVDLDSFINSTVLNANYSTTWIDLGTVDGSLYGVWFSASNKSLVWYDPAEFSAHTWLTPTTWTDMMTLTEVISNTTGKAPWSIGNESDLATGWPLTDWFEDILLRSAGPGIYDDLAAHNIPWTHPQVISATNIFAELFGNQQYQLGGKGGTLYTSFVDAMYPPFNDPPEAYLHRQGSFTQTLLENQFPTQTPGVDYAVFPFPEIQPAYADSVMGGGEVVMAFHDTPEVQALINYLITTEAAEVLIGQGVMSPNRSVNPNLFPDPNTRFAAERLVNASLFRFDLTDQLPTRLNEYVWSQMDDLVQAAPDPAAMEEVLERIETVASHPYWMYSPLVVFNSDW